MEGVKYESLKHRKLIDKVSGFIFLNPSIYFAILIFTTFVIVISKPHIVIFPGFEQYNPENNTTYSETNNTFFLNQHSKQNIFLAESLLIKAQQCSGFSDNERFDCFPNENASEDLCNKRGCCWAPVITSAKEEMGVPFCYYPSNYKSYRYINVSHTDIGITAYQENLIESIYPNTIQLLKIDVNYISDNIFQIKVSSFHCIEDMDSTTSLVSSLQSGFLHDLM